MNKYSISVVYNKQTTGSLDQALRSAIVRANSKDEALEAFILALFKEFKEWKLALKCVIEINKD